MVRLKSGRNSTSADRLPFSDLFSPVNKLSMNWSSVSISPWKELSLGRTNFGSSISGSDARTCYHNPRILNKFAFIEFKMIMTIMTRFYTNECTQLSISYNRK